MATSSAIDQSTLGWVKTEIDESLKQARQALESYVDDPGDDTQLRFCSTHLHQVTGTLEMVELDGAALLARENETLADMILRGDLEPDEKTYDVLTRGILSLPDYLARLQAGEPDVPLRLLPIVNEIREQYGEEKLDEIEFFNPDLSVRPPRRDPEAPAMEEDEVREMARKLRPRFQVALLDWLRDTSSEQAINNMVEVLDKLGQDTHLGVVQQLFWVASGLLEAMLNGELEATNERKKLFSRLDQQIRKLVEGKGKSELRNSSETLVKKILYQVGQAGANTPRISELRQAFDLDLLMGRVATSTDLDMEALPTPEVLASVANALSAEIYDAQEMLAAYFDPDQRDVESLKPLLDLLDKMSSTMGMLGAPLLKSLVDDLSAATVGIDEQRVEANEAVSMLMARALLLIESSSRDITRSAADWKRQIDQVSGALRSLAEGGDGVPTVDGLEVTDGDLTESDFMQLFGVVATEVRAGLQQVEEGFETFASDSSQKDILDEIMEQLGQIQGALQIVGQDVVSELVGKTTEYVANIRNGQLHPGEKVLDALAICIGTIGAYVDGVQFNRPNLNDLVEMATSEMQSAADAAGVVLTVVGGSADAETGSEEGDQGAASISAMAEEVTEDTADDLVPPPPTGGMFEDEDLDEEIMEIFVEDARDSIETINKNFPLWRDDQSNHDALLEVRRGFHTIKGSGRMVGAGEIAELSWSVENMLNKVRDERLEVSPEILDLVEQVRLVLPDMVAQLEGGPAPAANVEVLRLRGHELADGKVPATSNPGAAAAEQQTVATPADVSMAEQPEVPELDDALLQIFTSEAEGHISTIREELGQCREQGSCFASASLIRAAHTLAGSARSVGLEFMSSTCKEMEKLLQGMDEKQAVLSNRQLQILDGVADAITALLAALEADRAQLPQTTQKFVELSGELQTELARLPDEEGSSQEVPATEPAPVPPEPAVGAPAMQMAETVQDELDPELVEFFYEEAVDILNNINAAQNRWRENLGDMNAVSELKRALHTFKGGARMSGAMSLGGVAHNTETLIGRVEQGQMSADTGLIDLLDEIHDVLAHGIEQIKVNEPATGLAEVNHKIEQLMKGEQAQAPAAVPEVVVGDIPEVTEISSAPEFFEPPATPEPVTQAESAAAGVVTSTLEQLQDELDPELVEIFYEEALDILQNINDAQGRWRKDLSNKGTIAELKRALHTFKGGARMAGAMSLGAVAHNTETLIGRIEQGQMQPDARILDLLDEIHDSLAQGVAQIHEGQPVTGLQEPSRHLDAVLAGDSFQPSASPSVDQPDISAAASVPEIDSSPVSASPAESMQIEASPLPVIEVQEEEVLSRTESIAKGTSVVEGKSDKSDRKEQIRVRTDLLDTLVNYAGEVSISRARMEQQIFGFRENLGELSQNVVRFRDQLRELEIQSESQIVARAEQAGVENLADFDPLEFDRFSKLQQLSRSLTESLHDLGTIQNSLGNFASEAETVLQQQARVNTELQEGLMRTRMVSFSTQATRLRHIVRQTSRELGKQAQFEIEGAEVELDRNVLERMIGPFEHMIRNSLDHGLESEEERTAAGKPASGKIRIETRQEGNEIAIYFSDDGRGLNIPAIRKKAMDRDFMAHDSKLSDEEVTQFILMPGFSTAEKVTHISGRGVGMDVVHNEVKQLGGTMSVQTDAGQGTTFVIRLPLTLSIAQALMVYVGEQLYATPLSVIENIIEIPVDQVDAISVGEEPLLKYNNEVYPFMQLGSRLDVHSVPRNPKKTPILLVKSGNRVVAVQVDGLAGTREIVIKSVGPQINEVKGIAGATVLGDGTVVLIVDLQDLWVSDDMMHLAETVAEAEEEELPVRTQPLIMVVDDSLTVRKITSKHLVKRGMEAITAKDGLDAVEQLRDHIPDLMLVDIEMPRMDGYELTTRVRSTEEWKHIPIIMITSRAGQKHRDKAIGLGVDEYMSKPYQEEQLFENIERLVKTGRAK